MADTVFTKTSSAGGGTETLSGFTGPLNSNDYTPTPISNKTDIESVNVELSDEVIKEINKTQKIYQNPCP